ncbi:LytTR family DNA-binding domain-containing protein [Ruminococcus sp. HUN007]|uniref:LytR/AlgR family response regulator transcription factor n=1 Tax=Ruminococcus sp. HUN007 TaxID=1514668 RepID=UPI0005D2831A|nr:LytTR family DNA-binding domain-containing protein [Ruminococcus sp. HUN007]
MKIAVCDDEKFFREQLKKYISETSAGLEVDEYTCGNDLAASEHCYDIIFLDIEMPGMSGIETAEKLREKGSDADIIFLTSHIEYVYDAFKVRAFRFLQKPVDNEKFNEAFGNSMSNRKSMEKVVAEFRGVVSEIYTDNIVYIESSGEGTYVHDIRGNYYPASATLKDWSEKLNSEVFFRIHKTLLVSMKHVASLGKSSVKLTGYSSDFPVARRSIQPFRTAYLEFIKNNARMM